MSSQREVQEYAVQVGRTEIRDRTYTVARVARAAEEVEDPQGQWDLLRRRVSPWPRGVYHYAAELCRAYEAATGTCVGCD